MKKRLLYVILGSLLAITALSQAMEQSLLALFPLIGSAAFFISAWRVKNE
ncbi:hypothetical protein [Paenibacillus senegalensis]|nr:hypothetical protein [Paenibacillus senegalensis]